MPTWALRAYRWFSLGLRLLCVGRIVTVDVWALDPLGRIFSFLALGAAVLCCAAIVSAPADSAASAAQASRTRRID